MKKQNINPLALSKTSIVELNDNQLQDVNGGTSITTTVFSSPACAIVASAAVIIIASALVTNQK